ncbi:BofC C-terminal domain-containing protein [Halanaerobacter jeridensis]|uniref:Bypass of forespore C C-terminal domain-containing protein n=1 Tax=Halanaerobacter jeridensis TaxID=706427 RepID=A0A939BP45_9FIRM|nr:BofC C-terminal domain-containing protein [Halanaerobacter jeridensis]MBM7556268.1 hypothetical protein [Halanaerobacter jeridensis]
MKLKQSIILGILLIIVVAIISYQILDSPVQNEEQEDLDSKLKNELNQNSYLSDLIIEESNKLKEQESSFNFMKKPLLNFANIEKEQKFKLNYPHLELKFKTKEKLAQPDNSGFKTIDFNTGDMFLGIKDGYVALYRGDVLGEQELLKKTDILLKDLVQEDIKRLQTGIEIENRKELLSIIEGFSSAKN